MSEQRDEATEAFSLLTGLPDIKRVIQRGRDPQTARFTFELPDGEKITIGTIETLWSQVKLAQVMAVTSGCVVKPTKSTDWRNAIGALIRHATDVEEAPDDLLSDRILDWLGQYLAGSASTDRDGAAAFREPFTEDGEIWIHVEHFARWLRREYSERIPVHELRAALTDLGFASCRVQYNASGAGKTRKRTTARYYSAPGDLLDGRLDDAA